MSLPEPPGDPHVPPCPSRSLPETPMCPHVPPGAYRGACRVAERLLWATGMYLGSYRDMPRELPGYASGATGRHPPVGPGGELCGGTWTEEGKMKKKIIPDVCRDETCPP